MIKAEISSLVTSLLSRLQELGCTSFAELQGIYEGKVPHLLQRAAKEPSHLATAQHQSDWLLTDKRSDLKIV